MAKDEVTLLDIAKAARLVIDFTRGMDRERFLNDVKTQSAVLYQLLVIGEAVKRLSRDFRDKQADIPWTLIAGMRDHLIHGYDVVDWNEVWKTALCDVPELLTRITPLLPPKSSNGAP
ncbi:MAG: DUF86 domain-containing protein [Planctomycetes bacterium]|nr:DUF86 domain-containing protein [Planctomycetota bacterium]